MRKVFFILVGLFLFFLIIAKANTVYAANQCAPTGQCIQSTDTCPTGTIPTTNLTCPVASEHSPTQCCIPSSCTDPANKGICEAHPSGDHDPCGGMGSGRHADNEFTCSDASQDCCIPNNTILGNTTYTCAREGGVRGEDAGGNTFFEIIPSPTPTPIIGNCADDETCFTAVVQDGTGYPCIKTKDLSCTCKDSSTYTCNKNTITGSCGAQFCDAGITQGVPCDNNPQTAGVYCKEGLNASGTPVPGINPDGTKSKDYDSIVQCLSINTGVGDINLTPATLIGSLIALVLSVAGGVALLLIIFSGYNLAMSQGNPEKIKEGRERLTAAIIGLLFIIFSAVLLQIIGVQILQLPGIN